MGRQEWVVGCSCNYSSLMDGLGGCGMIFMEDLSEARQKVKRWRCLDVFGPEEQRDETKSDTMQEGVRTSFPKLMQDRTVSKDWFLFGEPLNQRIIKTIKHSSLKQKHHLTGMPDQHLLDLSVVRAARMSEHRRRSSALQHVRSLNILIIKHKRHYMTLPSRTGSQYFHRKPFQVNPLGFYIAQARSRVLAQKYPQFHLTPGFTTRKHINSNHTTAPQRKDPTEKTPRSGASSPLAARGLLRAGIRVEPPQ